MGAAAAASGIVRYAVEVAWKLYDHCKSMLR